MQKENNPNGEAGPPSGEAGPSSSETGKKKRIRGPIGKMPIPKMGKRSGWRSLIIYTILALIFFGFFVFSAQPTSRFTTQEPLSKVVTDIKDSKVDSVEIDGDRINIKLKDGQLYTSRKEENQSFFAALEAAKVDPTTANIEVKDRTFSQAWIGILTTLLPIGLMVVFFFFIWIFFGI